MIQRVPFRPSTSLQTPDLDPTVRTIDRLTDLMIQNVRLPYRSSISGRILAEKKTGPKAGWD
jgi:hypothetical protein